MSLIMNDIANDVKDTILYCTPERIHNTLWVEITVDVEKQEEKKIRKTFHFVICRHKVGSENVGWDLHTIYFYSKVIAIKAVI